MLKLEKSNQSSSIYNTIMQESEALDSIQQTKYFLFHDMKVK